MRSAMASGSFSMEDAYTGQRGITVWCHYKCRSSLCSKYCVCVCVRCGASLPMCVNERKGEEKDRIYYMRGWCAGDNCCWQSSVFI